MGGLISPPKFIHSYLFVPSYDSAPDSPHTLALRKLKFQSLKMLKLRIMCFSMNTLLYAGLPFCQEDRYMGQSWRSIQKNRLPSIWKEQGSLEMLTIQKVKPPMGK